MKLPAYLTLAMVFVLPLFFGFKNLIKKSILAERIIFKIKPIPNTKSFVLQVYNLRRAKTTITIKSQDGHIYHTCNIEGRNGYRELFNLRKMKKGIYHVEIVHPLGKRIKTINLKHKSVEIFESSEQNAYLPAPPTNTPEQIYSYKPTTIDRFII